MTNANNAAKVGSIMKKHLIYLDPRSMDERMESSQHFINREIYIPCPSLCWAVDLPKLFIHTYLVQSVIHSCRIWVSIGLKLSPFWLWILTHRVNTALPNLGTKCNSMTPLELPSTWHKILLSRFHKSRFPFNSVQSQGLFNTGREGYKIYLDFPRSITFPIGQNWRVAAILWTHGYLARKPKTVSYVTTWFEHAHTAELMAVTNFKGYSPRVMRVNPDRYFQPQSPILI